MSDVAKAVDEKLFATLTRHVFYQYGRSSQILTQLQKQNDSTTQKAMKYPLIALFMDFPEKMGTGYYTTVTFPKISIATITASTDPVSARYAKNFKTILYPVYQEFLRQCARHSNILINDPAAIPHLKWDRPGSKPEEQNLNDYLDAIELQNLELTFVQKNSCNKKILNNGRSIS